MIRLDTKNEVREFIEEVNKFGMDLHEYVDRARNLRRKINDMADAKKRYAKHLMYRDVITPEQYKQFENYIIKEKIECNKILSGEE